MAGDTNPGVLPWCRGVRDAARFNARALLPERLRCFQPGVSVPSLHPMELKADMGPAQSAS
jgi:hypothetical protein